MLMDVCVCLLVGGCVGVDRLGFVLVCMCVSVGRCGVHDCVFVNK